MHIASYLAVVGTALNLVRFVPQVVKSHREGFHGLSLMSWIIGFVEISIWATWAITSQQYIAGISSFVMCPIALWFVIRIVQCRKTYRSGPNTSTNQNKKTSPYGDSALQPIAA